MKICINCKQEITGCGLKYCSHDCQMDYQYKCYVDSWKSGNENGMSGQYQLSKHIVRYIKTKYDNKCSNCGWCEVNPHTGKVPLEIEHVDGNYLNNKEDNLILLCPNCHSLTATYKGANRGNGRQSRDKYNY